MLITLKKYAEIHKKNPATVRQKVLRNGFKTTQKLGRDWFIDSEEPYTDNRINNGNFVGWRRKKRN